MTTEKPAHIVRFEKLRERGRWLYIATTAGSVALVIGAIQWFNGHFRGKVFRSTRSRGQRLRWWIGWCCPNATATTTTQPTPNAKTTPSRIPNRC